MEQGIIANGIPYEEQPTGEWIMIDKHLGYYKCSRCGKGTTVRGYYCIVCGAKMKGGEEE